MRSLAYIVVVRISIYFSFFLYKWGCNEQYLIQVCSLETEKQNCQLQFSLDSEISRDEIRQMFGVLHANFKVVSSVGGLNMKRFPAVRNAFQHSPWNSARRPSTAFGTQQRKRLEVCTNTSPGIGYLKIRIKAALAMGTKEIF